jgi:hypothetical protein
MATYKLVFTVKDKYGKEKDLEGVTVNLDLASLNSDEMVSFADALKLDTYATDVELENAITDLKSEIPAVIEENDEAQQIITNVVEKYINSIKYNSFSDPLESEDDIVKPVNPPSTDIPEEDPSVNTPEETPELPSEEDTTDKEEIVE